MTNNPTIDGVSLLPCPLCGKAPRYVPADYVDNHGQPWPFAECNPCNVGAPVEFWQKRTGFDYSAHALQSTIAQLQARIGELESGRGEPVAYRCFDGEGNYDYWDGDEKDGGNWNFHTEPLFTAPPAPVAVVLPELESAFEKWWEEDGQYCRAGGGSYEKTFAYRAYEACLDATAALNEVKP